MEASKSIRHRIKKKMFIRIFKELSDSYKELTGNYNSMEKEIETINKNQEEMKNKISEIKKKYTRRTLAGVAHWIEHQPVNQKVTGSILSWDTCRSCGLRSNQLMFLSQIEVLLPLFLPPFGSL